MYSTAATNAETTVKLAAVSASEKSKELGVDVNSSGVYKLDQSKSDAALFRSDPIWCLLSSMHLIPSLVQLVASRSFIVEAVEPVCYVLECLGLRSFGASTAIVEAKGLCEGVVKMTLVPGASSAGGGDEASTFIVSPLAASSLLRLLITLAKSSRHCASSPIMATALEHTRNILTFEPTNSQEIEVQRLCLSFYQHLLGYALALPLLPIYLNLASVALQLPTHPLTVPYIQVLKSFLQCVKPITKPIAGNAVVSLSEQQKDILQQSGMWIAPIVKTLLTHVEVIFASDTRYVNASYIEPRWQ